MRRSLLLLALLFAAAASPVAASNTLISLTGRSAILPGGSGSTSAAPALTADGGGVAYESLSRAVPEDRNSTADVYFRDVEAGVTSLVSAGVNGTAGNNRSWAPAASADGNLVAFVSLASDIVEGDGNNAPDVFLRDRAAGTTVRLSVTPDGTDANGGSGAPAISADGRFAAFCSSATNLAPGDDNGAPDAFIVELATGAVTRVPPPDAPAAAAGGCVRVALSSDGGYLAYSYRAAAADGAPSAAVYRYDRGSGESVTVAPPRGAGGSGVNGLSISGDGGIVAFDSVLSDLVEGDGNGLSDVFAWSAADGSLRRVSVSSAGDEANRAAGTMGVGVSAGGGFVVYSSAASNLVPGDVNGTTDVFRYSLRQGETRIASLDINGGPTNGPSYSPSISADGGIVAFVSAASNLVASDSNRHPDVYSSDGPFAERASDAEAPPLTPDPNDFVRDEPAFADEDDGPGATLIAATALAALATLLVAGWFLLGRAPKS